MYVFLRFPGFKYKALTFSYDDGSIYDGRLLDIMREYGLKGTFNLNSGMFGNEGLKRMTREETYKTFAESGQEIASHGEFHQGLAELDSAAVAREVLRDREDLETMFQRRVYGLAYSNGSYNDKVVEILKTCGIKYARTTDQTRHFAVPADWLRWKPTCHHANPDLMQLAEAFLADQGGWYYWFHAPKLFYIWGHSKEFEVGNNWHIIEEFAKRVGKRDDVWYATNGEIYEYVQAYNRLEYSALGDIITNPTDKDVYLHYYGKDVMIPAGKTVMVEADKRLIPPQNK